MKQDDKPTPKPDTPAQPQGPPDEVPPSKPKPLDTDPGNIPIPPGPPDPLPGGGGG